MSSTTNTNNSLSQRRKDLIPDCIDDPSSLDPDDSILPSFHDLKRKTLQSLYGLDKNKDYNHALLKDKSPKGSVDEGIRSLVDLINAHPSFATLSSCSGRISLFDPNHEATLNARSNNNNENSSTISNYTEAGAEAEEGTASQESEMDDQYIELDRVASTTAATTAAGTGKGYGAWLITSHAQISPSSLFSALEDQSKSSSHHALIFKHEPLLLHVAASSLFRARQLLKIALDLGFRESGTVITPKRITVAIRSHSLALTVPIASKGRLRPNEEFMEELVKEANDRFVLNEGKLRRLEDMIEQILFTIQEEVGVSLNRVDCTLEELPGLNLWGHTTLAIPASDGNLDIVAIGGYGTGPNGKHKSSSRSNKIYNLGRIDGQWHDAWSEVKIDQSNLEEEVNVGGFGGKRVALTAREGCASCILPLQLESPLIGIFGGRASPARPNNDLLFLSYSPGGDAGTLYSPTDVRGDIPEPRWGHSFTALSGEGGRLALVVGGRNELSIEQCMYVLSMRSDVEGGPQSAYTYLKWDKITQTIPRFHHCASYISKLKQNRSDSDTEIIIVQGGLSSTALITEEGMEQNMPSLAISLNAKERSCTIRECEESNLCPVFGGSMCTLSTFREPIIFSSGGLASDAMKEEMHQENVIKIMNYIEAEDLNLCPSIQNIPYTMKEISGNCIKFGSMIHHSCVELPPLPQSHATSPEGCAEVVLVGGGVPTFAFGQAFAKSHYLTIRQQGKSTTSVGIPPQQLRKKNRIAVDKMKANGSRKGEANVLFVHKRYAKEVKTAMDSLSILDRNYRMVKADASAPVDEPMSLIAVPVTREGLQFVSSQSHHKADHPWLEYVVGSGSQVAPFSSVVLGRKG